jgi:hypothetical protein
MDHAAVDATLVSADAQQKIIVALPVEDELMLDFAIGAGVLCTIREDLLDDAAVSLYSGIH